MGFILIKVSGCALNLWESKGGCRCNHCVLKKINTIYQTSFQSLNYLFMKCGKLVSTRIADSVYFIVLPMSTAGKWRC